MTDIWTDRQTPKCQTVCLPPLKGGGGLIYIKKKEMAVLIANSEGPEQRQPLAPFDLGLYCLPWIHFWIPIQNGVIQLQPS